MMAITFRMHNLSSRAARMGRFPDAQDLSTAPSYTQRSRSTLELAWPFLEVNLSTLIQPIAYTQTQCITFPPQVMMINCLRFYVALGRQINDFPGCWYTRIGEADHSQLPLTSFEFSLFKPPVRSSSADRTLEVHLVLICTTMARLSDKSLEIETQSYSDSCNTILAWPASYDRVMPSPSQSF